MDALDASVLGFVKISINPFVPSAPLRFSDVFRGWGRESALGTNGLRYGYISTINVFDIH